MFINVKIGTKITISFMGIVILFLVVCVIIVSQVFKLTSLQDITAEQSQNLIEISEVESHFSDIYPHIADAIINKNVNNFSDYLNKIDKFINSDFKILEKYKSDSSKNSYIKNYQKALDEYLDLLKGDFLSALKINADIEVLQSYDGEFDDIRTTCGTSLQNLVNEIENDSKDANTQFQEYVSFMIYFIFGIIILGLIAAIVISLLLSRSISRPLTSAKDKILRMSEGNFQ